MVSTPQHANAQKITDWILSAPDLAAGKSPRNPDQMMLKTHSQQVTKGAMLHSQAQVDKASWGQQGCHLIRLV